jgi:hypothetical protein
MVDRRCGALDRARLACLLEAEQRRDACFEARPDEQYVAANAPDGSPGRS